MPYPLSSPVEISDDGPVELTLVDQTDVNPWKLATDALKNLKIDTPLGDVLNLYKNGGAEVATMALRSGVHKITLAGGAGLASDYQYDFPADPPSGPGQIIASSGGTNVFYDVHPHNLVIVRKNPGPGEFSSIKDAIDSIPVSPASNYPTFENPWGIHIYPGSYSEPNFEIPSYVYLIGEDMRGVKLSPSDAVGPFITIGGASGFAFLTIINTDSTNPALLVKNCGDYSLIHKVEFEDCHQCIKLLTDNSATEDSYFYGECIGTTRAFDYSMYVESTGTHVAQASLDVFYVWEHNDTSFVADGPDSYLIIQSSQLEGDGTGDGVVVKNGAVLDIRASYIKKVGRAVYVPNDGTSPSVLLSGVLYDLNTVNLEIDNPLTTGRNEGYTPYSKSKYPKASSFFVADKDQHIITVSSKGADFSSIADALDAITDSSQTNQYSIYVGPGVYPEPPLVLKPYVSVQGFFQTQCMIMATDPNLPLVTGVGYSSMVNLTLLGENPMFPPGVYPPYLVEYLGDPGGYHFRVDNVVFGSAQKLVHVGSTNGPAIYIQMGTIINMQSAIAGGIVIDDAGPNNFPILHIIDRLVWTPESIPTGFEEFIKVASSKAGSPMPNISGVFNNMTVGAPLGTQTGTFLEISGPNMSVLSNSQVGSFVTGINLPNSAEMEILITGGLIMYNNGTDINIQNPNAQGTIVGNMTRSKINIVSGASFGVTINDPDGSLVLNGDLFQGNQWPRVTNVSRQIQQAASLGIVGTRPTVTTTPASLTITVGGGQCYITKGLFPDTYLWHVTFPAKTFAVDDNTLSYIYVDSSETIQKSTSVPDGKCCAIICTVKTYQGSVTYIQDVARSIEAQPTQTEETSRTVMGVLVSSGCQASPGSAADKRAVKMGAGNYYFGSLAYSPLEADNVNMIAYYGGSIEETGVINLPKKWDDAGVLTDLTSSEWTKHAIYMITNSTTGVSKYFLVYGQQTYSTELLAKGGPIPVPPPTFVMDMLRISTVVVGGSDPDSPLDPDRFIDVRPTLSFSSASFSSTLDHNSLLNLGTGNAHPQYFRVDGTSTMSGPVQLGTQNVTGTGGNLLMGVDITTHASRHAPGGADPLPTAAPTNIGTSNSAGTAASFSRSDHVHAHGSLSDQTLHALASASAHGFMSLSDFSKLSASTSSNTISTLVQRSSSGDVQLSSLTLTNTDVSYLAKLVPSPANFGGPNHTISLPIPASDDSLVLNNVQATLTNKTFVDSTTLFQDDANATKLFRFEASNITAGQTRVYTVPDLSTVLVGRNTSDSLTNKTITDVSNTVTANSLRTATGSVDGSGSPQPLAAGYIPTTNAGGTTFSWILNTSGTVTSVGLSAPSIFTVSNSPVTSSGTLTFSTNTQTANTIWAGPSSGIAAVPSFRLLTIADLPTSIPNANLANSSITINTTGGITGGGSVSLGSTITLTGSGGTVTSITAGTGLTGSTITGSGTIALAIPVSVANGGTGFTSYTIGDLLVANTSTTLTKLADVATGSVLLSGGVGVAPSYGKVVLTTHVSGVLPIANGGTNSSTGLSNNCVMVSNSGAIREAAALSNGQLLIGSTGAAPVAANITGVSGITVTNGPGTITISGAGLSNTRQNIPLITYPIYTIAGGSSTNVAYFPWVTSNYSSYEHARIIVYMTVVPSSNNATIALKNGATVISQVNITSSSVVGIITGSTIDPSDTSALNGNPLLILSHVTTGSPSTPCQYAGVVLELW